jgi:glycolate oxidase
VSGEHGIGTAKAPYIGMELDRATLATMQAIKQALDPNNIMNPGKIFPKPNRRHARHPDRLPMT